VDFLGRSEGEKFWRALNGENKSTELELRTLFHIVHFNNFNVTDAPSIVDPMAIAFALRHPCLLSFRQ
jgi:hypothetical protein